MQLDGCSRLSGLPKCFNRQRVRALVISRRERGLRTRFLRTAPATNTITFVFSACFAFFVLMIGSLVVSFTISWCYFVSVESLLFRNVSLCVGFLLSRSRECLLPSFACFCAFCAFLCICLPFFTCLHLSSTPLAFLPLSRLCLASALPHTCLFVAEGVPSPCLSVSLPVVSCLCLESSQPISLSLSA